MNIRFFISILVIYSTLALGLKTKSQMTKVLVTTGTPFGNGVHSEVIDLKNPNSTCQSFENYPVAMDRAFGGLIQNDAPLVCGGFTTESESKCYLVGLDQVVAELNRPRDSGASVVLQNEILWVTGGFDGNLSSFTKTTEFVQLDKPTENGPDLPEEFYYHCMTNFNETLVLLLGGYSTAKSNLLVDVSSKDFKMSNGPQLINGRDRFACGTFEFGAKTMVIVAGGFDGKSSLSTEIWDPMSENGWVEGPDLPESCTYSSMVTSPSGQGVILFGCNENPIGEHFYELTTNENGNFSWKIMAQKMTFPRSGATAMLLPDELVSCT